MPLLTRQATGWVLWSRVRLGYAAFHAGNLAEARQHLEEPARSFTKDGYTIGTIFALVGLFATVGKNERTPGWADALREKINNPRSPLEQVDVDFRLSACIARMGEAAYKQAYT